MPFHLILPGLLWPQKALRDTAHDLTLPNLSWMLGRGSLRWQEPLPVESWLCRELGCAADPQQAPAAAVRLLGDGGTPGDAIWLCADPVHLRIDQGRAHLFAGDLQFSDDELRQLGKALEQHFAAVGEFHITPQGHGYLRLDDMPRLRTTPPSAAAGRGQLLPAGEDARTWLQSINEAQMLLHGLPLNARREAEGRPAINSIWLWGPGRLPTARPPASAEYRRLIGDEATVRGLAAWAGLAHQPVTDAASLRRHMPGALLLLGNLQRAGQTLDAGNWRAKLLEIESAWLQPLGKALSTGHLRRLRITALGDEAALEITVSRADAMKFWRRPKPLHQLEFPPQ